MEGVQSGNRQQRGGGGGGGAEGGGGDIQRNGRLLSLHSPGTGQTDTRNRTKSETYLWDSDAAAEQNPNKRSHVLVSLTRSLVHEPNSSCVFLNDLQIQRQAHESK